jgi:hypothetical protein
MLANETLAAFGATNLPILWATSENIATRVWGKQKKLVQKSFLQVFSGTNCPERLSNE